MGRGSTPGVHADFMDRAKSLSLNFIFNLFRDVLNFEGADLMLTNRDLLRLRARGRPGRVIAFASRRLIHWTTEVENGERLATQIFTHPKLGDIWNLNINLYKATRESQKANQPIPAQSPCRVQNVIWCERGEAAESSASAARKVSGGRRAWAGDWASGEGMCEVAAADNAR